MRSHSFLLVCSFLASTLDAQDRPDLLTFGGVAAAAPVAALDPTGVLEVRDDESGQALRIGFPAFTWVASVTKVDLADDDAQHSVRWRRSGDEEFAAVATGFLVLDALGADRVHGRLFGADDDELATFDLEPVLRPREDARVVGGPAAMPEFGPAAEKPRDEDLVFAAFGNQGSGLGGQRRVGNALAELAATGPLDFVLLLGDNALPDGFESMSDPKFQTGFEQPYDPRRLMVPFHVVLGDRDHGRSIEAQGQYGIMNPRWTMTRPTYTFVRESHGQRFEFFGTDSTAIGGNVRSPMTRRQISYIVQALEVSRADWKIVFLHHPLRSHGVDRDETFAAKLRERLDPWFERFGVDVVIAGGEHSQQLLMPDDGITHVVTGGGGGPELARSVTWADDTKFAATGGGFAWFRFDGTDLEISFRDADGRTRFVQRVGKRRAAKAPEDGGGKDRR